MYHDLIVNHDTSTLIMIFIMIADDIIKVTQGTVKRRIL